MILLTHCFAGFSKKELPPAPVSLAETEEHRHNQYHIQRFCTTLKTKKVTLVESWPHRRRYNAVLGRGHGMTGLL